MHPSRLAPPAYSTSPRSSIAASVSTLADGVRLFETPDLLAVGWLANREREKRHGALTFFNYNIRLEATNVCVASCLFCAFARLKPGDDGAYTMSLEQAWDKLRQRAHQPLTEIHVVNGLHPDLPFDYYTELLRGFKRIRPDIHLKCFTAVEIAFFADLYGKTDEQVLRELMDAGLDSLPGGGAEIFAERVRRKIAHDKCGSDRYLEIHRIAHRLGMRTNVTMLYGHIETNEERVDHMMRARALQDETGGFQAFIPLAFHPDNNQMRKLPAPTASDTLRVHAVARLMCDNIAHVKAFWIATGVEVAQTALWFGVDDLDGTVQEEKIYHMAGARTPEAMTTRQLERLVRAAGREPVERDTLYNVVNAHATSAYAAGRQPLTLTGTTATARESDRPALRPVLYISEGVLPDYGGRLRKVSQDCRKRSANYADSAADRIREGPHRRAPGAAGAVSRPVRRGDGSPHRRGQGDARPPRRHPRPSLSARRSDQVRRLHRRLLQARRPGQQAPRRRVHRLLRRALHGRERRRAQRRASAGHPARSRRRLLDGRHGRAGSARAVLGRSRADARAVHRRAPTAQRRALSCPSPTSTPPPRSKRSAASTAASSAPRPTRRRR